LNLHTRYALVVSDTEDLHQFNMIKHEIEALRNYSMYIVIGA